MSSPLERACFYGILDTGYIGAGQFPEKAQALLAGGAGILEIRAKGASCEEASALIEAVLPLCTEAEVPLTLNDEPALAAQYPGLGAHIGQDDEDPAAARAALGPDRVLGLSTHSLVQARAAIELADVIDYFCVGPVYATATKPEYEAVGLELIKAVSELDSPLPWFAIGGVNRRTARAVKEAGAERVVVVSDALDAEDTAAVVREIRAVMRGTG